MSDIKARMEAYHQQHRGLITKITHWIGVPLVFFSILILLGWLEIGVSGVIRSSLDWFLIVFLGIYYLFFDIMLAIITVVIMLLLNVLSHYVGGGTPNWQGLWVFAVCFGIGWFLLLIGHFLTKDRPAFMSSIKQVMVAPLYVCAELCAICKYKKPMDKLSQ